MPKAHLRHRFWAARRPRMKRVPARSSGLLAIVTSFWFFDDVVRQCEDAKPATYCPIAFKVKKTVATAWIAYRILRPVVESPNVTEAGRWGSEG
jgi:hypothetical protein